MVRLRTRIEAIDQSIRQEAGTVAGGQGTTLAAEYQAAVAEERKLQGLVSQLKGSVLNERGNRIQYNILQREVDTNRTLYDAFSSVIRKLGLPEASAPTPCRSSTGRTPRGRPTSPT
jgi:uncharacterized protein involved in exopolysaccharide biosynthesis